MSELISAYVGEDGEVLNIISDDSDFDLGDGTTAESSAAQRVILYVIKLLVFFTLVDITIKY